MTSPAEPSPPSKTHYEYGPRQIPAMPERELRPGEGRISGYLSILLGSLVLFGGLCFRFPEVLTTRELREVYDVDLIRMLVRGALIACVGFGLFSFVRTRGKRWMGAFGVAFALLGHFVGGSFEERSVAQLGPSLGLDWLALDLLGSTLLFVFLEKLFPKYREQPILRPEWSLDLTYFALNHLLIGVLLIVANSFAPAVFGWAVNASVQGFVSGLWLPLQVVLLMIAADFVQYWVHRAYHEVPSLWGIHAVHHSAEYIDWLAGSRTHVLQTLLDRTLVMIPLYLLGARPEALNLYVLIVSFQAVFIHANVGIEFGPLGYLFVTPKFHHWHHSKDKPAIDTNYGAHVPLWDLVFGTFHMPDTHWPKEYGTLVRLPRTFVGQFGYPFGATKPEEEIASRRAD